MPEPFSKIRRCLTCHADTKVILHRRQMSSGGFHFCWICSRCQKIYKHNGRTWISGALVEQFLSPQEISNLPVLAADFPVACAKCGAPKGELHHWAPKAIFGAESAEEWPTDYLCPACHKLWHDTITAYRAA